MKRFVIMGLACLALLVPARLYAAPVTIDVTGGDVRTVLLAVARMGNVPLIVDDGVTGTVTAHLTGEPEELLHLIAAARGIHIERRGDVFLALGTEARTENRRVHIYPVRFATPRSWHMPQIYPLVVKENAETCRKLTMRVEMRSQRPIPGGVCSSIPRRTPSSFTVRKLRRLLCAKLFPRST